MTAARREAARSLQARAASHAKWLPAPQAQLEERFWYESLVESGVLPDFVIRAAIRRMLQDRLREEDLGSEGANRAKSLAFVEEMKRSPIALRTDSANAQHYEVPAAFFQSVLGPRLKYSSAFYADGCASLGEAEEAMLGLTCERAQLEDGQEHDRAHDREHRRLPWADGQLLLVRQGRGVDDDAAALLGSESQPHLV